MPALFIDGEAGTTGLLIRDAVAGLSLKLLSLPPDRRKDQAARLAAMRAADVTILCLPDDAARDAVAMAGDSGTRFLDASSAHRTHPDWIYGFPEIAPDRAALIARAPRVSNPGCYATGAIGLLRPLIAAGVLPAQTPVTLNGISGYSGGGRQMIAAHEAAGGPAVEYYGLDLAHKHIPEIMAQSGLTTTPIFVPSVGHFARGMVVTMALFAAQLRDEVTRLETIYRDFYPATGKVRVVSPAARPVAEAMAGSDAMEIAVYLSQDRQRALVMARLDNLGKGASAAAMQNMRLMLGIDP